MSKESYTRYSMNANMLKKVLIRVDYDGVTDIGKWVETVKSNASLRTKFSVYVQNYLNRAKLNLSNNDEIARQRALPVNDFESEPVHRFSDSHFPGRDDSVIMDIARLFMTFEINCKHYSTIDDYFCYLEEYFTEFLKSDPYIKIKRIGIRKLGGDSFSDFNEMRQTFEPEFFDGHKIDNDDTVVLERTFHDSYMKVLNAGTDTSRLVKINYTTRCRRIDGEKPFQSILDIDGYVDEYIIKENSLTFPQDLHQTLDAINNYMFGLYKKSVTELYLSKYGKQE